MSRRMGIEMMVHRLERNSSMMRGTLCASGRAVVV